MNPPHNQLAKLTPQEEHIIIYKSTEAPFSGIYNDFFESGIYVCKQCETSLFSSESKFRSMCGWASFDDCFEGVVMQADRDGRRTEIVCKNCKGHLGHVFEGEGFTPKNTRHCVNSLSIKFIGNS